MNQVMAPAFVDPDTHVLVSLQHVDSGVAGSWRPLLGDPMDIGSRNDGRDSLTFLLAALEKLDPLLMIRCFADSRLRLLLFASLRAPCEHLRLVMLAQSPVAEPPSPITLGATRPKVERLILFSRLDCRRVGGVGAPSRPLRRFIHAA